MTDKVDFRPVVILDREVMFHSPNEIQAAMLHRVGKLGEAAGARLEKMAEDDPQRSVVIDQVLEAIARSLDVIEAMVVYESDQHWLVSQMLAGKIDMVMLTESLTKSLGQKGNTPAKKVARRAVS